MAAPTAPHAMPKRAWFKHINGDFKPLVFGRLKSRCNGFHNEATNVAVQFGPHDRNIRNGAICDPAFRPIEYESLTLALRASFHTAWIGAMVRFGQSETANLFASGEQRQPFA